MTLQLRLSRVVVPSLQQALCPPLLPCSDPTCQKCKGWQHALYWLLHVALSRTGALISLQQALCLCWSPCLRSDQPAAQHLAAILAEGAHGYYVAAGVMPPLVALLRSNQPDVQCAAAGVLQNLTAGSPQNGISAARPCRCLLLYIVGVQPASYAKASSSLFVESCSWLLPDSGRGPYSRCSASAFRLARVSPACRASLSSISIEGLCSTEQGGHLCSRRHVSVHCAAGGHQPAVQVAAAAIL